MLETCKRSTAEIDANGDITASPIARNMPSLVHVSSRTQVFWGSATEVTKSQFNPEPAKLQVANLEVKAELETRTTSGSLQIKKAISEPTSASLWY